MRRFWLFAFLVVLLAGCATPEPRFDAADVRAGITPADATEGDAVFEGERVLWGGRVIDVSNEAEHTVLEVLGYPLDGDQRPDTDASAGHRFLVREEGFLDPEDYAAGRLVSVVGTLGDNESGRIGDAERSWPVVRAEDIQLWSERPSYRDRGPGVNFGVGVIFGN